jgi:hypothetical protein
MAQGAFRLLEMLYVRMGPPQGIEEAQERFLKAERSMLEQRRNGSLDHALGEPLPGESPEELPSPRARSLRSPGNGRKTPSPLTLAA